MNTTRAGLAVLAVLLVATPALAHVPAFPTDNDSPERAVHVHDAAKSWSFYDRLSDGGVAYYRLDLAAGQRLQVSTFTPDRGAFAPSLVVMSPALSGREAVPPGVVVPEGMGARVVEGERSGPSYEPFAPSADYRTASFERAVEADATYLVAVYEPGNRSGAAGVAVGYRESFTPVEYVTVPFTLVGVRGWAGQGPLVVLGPWLLVAAGVAGLARSRRPGGWERPIVGLALAGGAALVLGSAASTALQAAVALSRTGPTPAALVTAAFVLVPAVAGGWALRVALRADPSPGPRTRVGLLAAAVAALVTWAGFLVGPALLAAVALVARRSAGQDDDGVGP